MVHSSLDNPPDLRNQPRPLPHQHWIIRRVQRHCLTRRLQLSLLIRNSHYPPNLEEGQSLAQGTAIHPWTVEPRSMGPANKHLCGGLYNCYLPLHFLPGCPSG